MQLRHLIRIITLGSLPFATASCTAKSPGSASPRRTWRSASSRTTTRSWRRRRAISSDVNATRGSSCEACRSSRRRSRSKPPALPGELDRVRGAHGSRRALQERPHLDRHRGHGHLRQRQREAHVVGASGAEQGRGRAAARVFEPAHLRRRPHRHRSDPEDQGSVPEQSPPVRGPADAVAAYLASKGVPERNLVVVGYGPFDPRDTGKGDAAKGRNRRVEIVVGDAQ